MSRYPWRNTSEDIAKEAQSQWETPGGAQEKADAAEQAAKDYSDGKLNAHIGTGGAAHANVVAGGAAGFMTGPDKTKLDGVASGANNYVHPATHPPSIIAQDASNRFVTDTEKADWSAKAPSTLATATTDGLMPATDKDKLNKATNAPTASTIVARDASGRAQVAAPSVSGDIARKAETDAVQANLDSHAGNIDVHVTAADHAKLDGVQAGAEVNQNAFSSVNGVAATSKTDTLQFAGGTGITITEDPTNKRVTVTATGTATPGPHASSHITGGTDVIPNAATNGASGLMSGTDAQFVRIEGETKAGAQNKADAALVAANEYTDGKTAIVSAEVDQALSDANEYTDTQIGAVNANYIRQPGYAATTGTGSAYVVTLNPVPTALPNGFGITIVPHVTNAAGATLNVNGLGATPLKKQDGTAYAAGDLLVGKPYTFRKVGSDFLADSGGGEVEINGQLQQHVVYAESIDANDPIYTQLVIDNGDTSVSDYPTLSARGVTFSADRVYMVVVQSSSPFLNIYKLVGGVYTKLTNPAILPTGDSFGATFSLDGVYLAVAHDISPFVTIYKRSGDTFTKMPNPSTLPTGTGRSVAFSHDDVYLSVAHFVSPFVTIYKRSGDTFTKLSNPSTLPAGSAYSAVFSSDDSKLVVTHASTPFVTIYKRSGDTFTKLSNPSALPPSNGIGLAFRLDDQYLAVSFLTAPYFMVYKITGDAFDKIADPIFLPTGVVRSVSFSQDNSTLVLAHETAPFVTVYYQTGDSLIKSRDPEIPPTGGGQGVGFSTTDFAIVYTTAPYVSFYKTGVKAFKSTNKISDVIQSTSLGYALSAGVSGDTKDAILIWR
ncbi:hypothetical protein [Paenibacillus pabuli]|uniref:hypothetical protein n=1 Tax=Paenibacillus pabuli TaxID=1472 RepID=UPI001FFF5335|nr:hypothetical protein [Paenibacillus pabuli]UPK42465.1 hypothetical protein KET34_25240 [Paenibacillus pabuli]